MRRSFAACFPALAALLLAACATGVTFPSAKLFPEAAEPPTVRGLLFKPDGNGPFPAVVLLHTCGGVKPHVSSHWPDFLTGLGYAVLTVDSYGPRGAGRCTELPGHPRYQALDAYGALDHLAALPFADGDRVAVIGFSAGAIAINSELIGNQMGNGRPRDFRAAIALYGRCGWMEFAVDKVPLMEIVAEHDVNHAPSCIRAGESGKVEVHVLKDAYHAFDSLTSRGQTDSGGSIMIYNAGAVSEAEDHVKAFLARHLGR